MMNYRHPTTEERQQIRSLVHEIGAVEVLRVIGQLVANWHSDATVGDEARSLIYKVAKDLDAMPEKI